PKILSYGKLLFNRLRIIRINTAVHAELAEESKYDKLPSTLRQAQSSGPTEGRDERRSFDQSN
ncbi:MAG TPA: hypothetical protein DE042_09995, partial [Colwellia sp.]|nr:hypothetical protein [Colwellia sp.]